VGVLFIPAALAAAGGMHVGGVLVDVIGCRRPDVLGCLIVSLSTFGLSRLSLNAPVSLLIVLMTIQAFSLGMSMPPSLVAGLSEVPPHLLTHASAIRTLTNQVGGAVAVATLGAVVNSATPTNATRNEAWQAYAAV